MNADFTVLVRTTLPYANAGFPTKFAESLSLGIPVVANLTSDISKYLIDGKSGIVLEDDSVESCLVGLRRILSLDQSQIIQMKKQSREIAEASFSIVSYNDMMYDFLRNIGDSNL